MTNIEFKTILAETFNGHMFMKDRDYHTVNELLYVLRHDEKLNGLEGVNISVMTLNNQCICIPCLDAFVDIKTLSVWFDDATIEFEIDEFDHEGRLMKFSNITIWEREVR